VIRETHGGAVDLQLTGVPGATNVVACQSHQAFFPRRELLFVERVAEREHRHEVRVFGELARRLGANALRRRVGGAKRGMCLFELQQLAIKAIVLGVGYRRLVEHVILV